MSAYIRYVIEGLIDINTPNYTIIGLATRSGMNIVGAHRLTMVLQSNVPIKTEFNEVFIMITEKRVPNKTKFREGLYMIPLESVTNKQSSEKSSLCFYKEGNEIS